MNMMKRVWLLGALFAGVVGCSSRTTTGESGKPNPDAGTGGMAGNAPVGGAGGGNLPGGGSAGGGVVMPSGGTTGGVDCFADCSALVTIPIVSLPDGTLTTCVYTLCNTQLVTGGQVAVPLITSTSGRAGSVKLVDGELRASWTAGPALGSSAPSGCFGDNSVAFKSPGGTVVSLFSGMIPTVVTSDPCLTHVRGSVVVPKPIDIAAEVQAHEGGAGGAGGTGGEPAGGAGGAP